VLLNARKLKRKEGRKERRPTKEDRAIQRKTVLQLGGLRKGAAASKELGAAEGPQTE